MDYDIIIENGLLLTMEGDLNIVNDSKDRNRVADNSLIKEKGIVLIKDGVIADCGRFEDFSRAQAETRIDAKGKIIMPGLVNCHTHMPMSMFRGLADDLPLDVWLNEHIFPAEAEHVNPESVEKWSKHSMKEMLLSGTTTCCDGYFYEANVAKAAMESEMRVVAGQGVIDFPAPGVPDPKQKIQHAIDFVKKFKHASSLLTPSIFCHSPYTCSKETLVEAKKAAVKENVLFQIHVAETRNEASMIAGLGEQSIVEYLYDLGILDDNTLIVHSIWIDDKDIKIIKKSGAGVAHCPESNMKLASGIAPVTKMIDQGIAVGLGTDGMASNNDHDLFGEMGTAAKLHKVAQMDPCVMDAKTCLKMATVEGAKAIGLDHLVGSLEKGKRADIILVDMEKPHLIPMYDPYSALVYSAKSSDVSMVLIDGQIKVREGILI